MTISHEMPVGLKRIKKELLQEIEKPIACEVHLSETCTVEKRFKYIHCTARETEQLTNLT